MSVVPHEYIACGASITLFIKEKNKLYPIEVVAYAWLQIFGRPNVCI